MKRRGIIMKLNYVESTDINNGAELAEWAEEYIFINDLGPDDVDSDKLLIMACEALGWVSVPQTGGLNIVWEEN